MTLFAILGCFYKASLVRFCENFLAIPYFILFYAFFDIDCWLTPKNDYFIAALFCAYIELPIPDFANSDRPSLSLN